MTVRGATPFCPNNLHGTGPGTPAPVRGWGCLLCGADPHPPGRQSTLGVGPGPRDRRDGGLRGPPTPWVVVIGGTSLIGAEHHVTGSPLPCHGLPAPLTDTVATL